MLDKPENPNENPKQIFGDKKPPLAYIPLSAKLALLEALFDGKLKYGPHNWRERPVNAMTYINAAERHLELYKVGEEFTRDTLVQNLGGVMACCAILIDAALHGTLIDDRPISPEEADLLHSSESWVEMLKEEQAKREMAQKTPDKESAEILDNHYYSEDA